MELACPSCATHFTVPDGAIGAKGRKLKCSQCGHVWRQMPPESASVAVDQPVAARAAAAPPPPPPPPRAPEPEPEPPPPAGAVPLEMEPGSYTPDDDIRQPQGDEFLSMDADPFESLQRGGATMLDDPLSGLDLDGGKGDDNFGRARADDDGGFDGAELDDLLGGEPEPIPSMFARGDDDDDAGDKPKSRALVWVLLTLLVLAGLAGGAWMFRERLVEAVPQLEGVFDSVGVPAAPLGYGLMFREVTSDLVDRGNGQMLVVRGFIANDSDRERPVPFIRLALYDRTDALLDQITAEPPQPMLEPGATVGFRIQADNPSAATQRFTVDWTEPPALDGQPAPGK
ncbi:DUF3426 domain-containing protein [Novispirillum sp. DQ9]|uniref:DUF3426 domain-containing protein n=1 Tax=Novispirillum sp. DQ9 TaxID=3398612 RepID=UPI003C7D4599